MTTTTNEQHLETAILLDVATRFVSLKQSTARRALLIKFKNQPAAFVINNLTHIGILRRKNANVATTDEEYLPAASAFELCGDNRIREEAKHASTIVLTTLQQMFIGEQKKEGFQFADLKRHVEYVYTNQILDDATLKLGLYLAKDLGVLASHSLTQPDETEVEWFQIAESAANMPHPEKEWDRVMAGFSPRFGLPSIEETEKSFPAEGESQEWERTEPPLGGGGQSDVFLARSPARVCERANCLQRIRAALDGDKRADLAEAIWSYVRPESTSELGALKVFRIPPEGESLTSKELEAIERLKNEIAVLSENRRGLPKLLDSNVKKRWIVTEYFPERSLKHHPLRYRGKAVFALTVFRSLVETVASLHKDGYVHRDIKPPNVFVGKDDELVLGDFGIVYVPSAGERVTLIGEKVGPRDYMPQWANLGERLEKVEPNFDVYMLGKLLWCMVDGRAVLPREYHHRPEFDLTKTFPDDPDMFVINRILDKCVVEESSQCLSSAQDLLLVVDKVLTVMTRGGQLLSPGVPRPCHVCGNGFYQPQSLQQANSVGGIRIWTGGSDTVSLTVQTFTCDSCGHVEFFKK